MALHQILAIPCLRQVNVCLPWPEFSQICDRFLFLFTPYHLIHLTEYFSLLVPGPISAPSGSSVVLSCLVSPPFDPDDVQWYRPGHVDNPVISYENQKIKDSADPQYRGRAFFTAGLKNGDVSLRLENLTMADRGQYVCYVHHRGWYNTANISLTVRGKQKPGWL